MSTTTTTAKIKLALEGASAVEAGLAFVQTKIASAKGAMIGLAGGLTVGAFTNWIKNAIDAGDESNKLAQKAALAVKDVAGLTLAFEQSGLSADDMSKYMSKLSKGMNDGNKAFAAMGLTVQNQDGTLKGTRQMLGEIADKFSTYTNTAEKSALAMELFGKSGSEMLPVLNGGSAALEEYDRIAKVLGLTLDEETAQAAEKFNDTLELMGKAGQGVATQIAAQLLPTLTSVAGEMFNAMAQGDGLRKTADFLAAALKGLYTVGAVIVRMFTAVGTTLGAAAAAVAAGLRGDFAEASGIWKMHMADHAASGKEFADSMTRLWSGAGNASVAAMAATGNAATRIAPRVAEPGKAARESKSEFDKLRESLEKGLSKAYSEAEGAANGYNKSQMRSLEIFSAPTWKTFTDSQRADIAVLLEKTIKSEQAEAATKALAETTKAAHEAYAAFIKGYSDSAAGVEKRITDMQAEAAALQLSQDWQISLAQAVEHTTIARLKEQQVAAMGDPAIVAQLQREIEAREKIIGLLGQKEAKEQADEKVKAEADAAKRVQDEWQKTWDSVQQGFVDAMMQGGDSVMKWLKDSFKRLVLAPILSPQGGANGASGGVGSALDGLGTLWDFMTGKGMGKLETGVETFATKLGVAGDSAKLLGQAAGMAGNAMAGYQLHGSISGGYKIGNGKAMDAISAIGSAIGGPIVGVVTGLLSKAFGKKLTEVGVKATFDGKGGVQAQNYEFYKGGWFSSDKEKTSKMAGAGKFEQQLMNLQEGAARMAEALGLSGDSVRKFAGDLKINLMGLSNEEAAKKVAEELLNLRVRMLEAVPGMEQFAQAGETVGEAMRRLVSETDEALAKAGISSQSIADVIVQGMTGRLSAAQVGEQLSDIIIGGIYNTIAGGFAQQISDVFMTQIMVPVMSAITAGVPLSQVISDEAINKVVDTAIKAAEAMDVIFNNEAFQAAMEKIKNTIGKVSFVTAGAAPYVNAFTGSVDATASAAEQAAKEAADAAAQIKAAWKDMGDTLTDEIRRIKGEIVGDTSGGLAYTQAQFAIATAQARAGNMDAAAMLPELSRALIELAKNSAGSLSDLRVMQGSTASSLIETRRILSQQYGFEIPAYASGGSHAGGWAIVGEQGPELVNMPASTVYTNGNSRSMLDNTELVNEVRALRVEVSSLRSSNSAIASATQNLDRNFDRVTQGGEAVLTVAA